MLRSEGKTKNADIFSVVYFTSYSQGLRIDKHQIECWSSVTRSHQN